jgi:protocatechuate 3,4-dioxygenase beta subunit
MSMSKSQGGLLAIAALALLTLCAWLVLAERAPTSREHETPTSHPRHDGRGREPAAPSPTPARVAGRATTGSLPPDLATTTASGEAVIAGRVSNTAGEWLEGVEVAAWWRPAGERDAAHEHVEARTDARGGYVIALAIKEPAVVDLEAEDRAHQPVEREGLAITPGSRLDGVDLVLAPAGAIAGRVTDTRGLPVEGASVEAVDIGVGGLLSGADAAGEADALFGNAMAHVESAETDAHGRYRLSPLTEGRFVVRARADQHLPGQPRIVELADTSEATCDLTLDRGLSISGVVVQASGAPVIGAEVTVSRSDHRSFGFVDSVSTDDAGRFEHAGLAPGAHDVRVWSSEGLGEAVAERVEAGTRDLRIVAPAAVVIEGRIRDAGSGDPVPGAQVHLYTRRGDITTGTGVGADRDGRFRRGGLAAGDHVIVVTVAAYAPAVMRITGTVAGETRLVDVRLHGGVELDVLVEAAPDGLPVVGAEVTAVAGASPTGDAWFLEGSRATAVGSTGEDGRAFVRGVSRGTVEVHAAAEGRPPGIARVEVGEGQERVFVRVVLPVGGAIAGRAVRRSGEPIAGATIVAESDRQTGAAEVRADGDGRFELAALLPGRWNVQLWPEGRDDLPLPAAMRQVVVRDGATTEVELVID